MTPLFIITLIAVAILVPIGWINDQAISRWLRNRL